MFKIKKSCFRFLILFLKVTIIFGFNLSPVPNLILREPKLGQAKSDESSYFGFALNFRGQSIMISAPRANSIMNPELHFDQPGVIYKCGLENGSCSPFLIEVSDFANTEPEFKKNHDMQWMGASMHGGSKDTDNFIACAPRFIREYKVNKKISMNGVCYWVPNTTDNSTSIVKTISPLKAPGKQTIYSDSHNSYKPLYIFGEQGISAHISEHSNEILIGAPGVYRWRGAVVYKKDPQSTKTDVFIFHGKSNSYFGYSVTTGVFDGRNSKKVLYVISAPQSNYQQGEVYVMDIITKERFSTMEPVIAPLHGSQFGEYFGYVVLAEDFNGDGFTDLAISAPFYKVGSYFDNGAVYIFMNKEKLNFELVRILTSGSNSPTRFGITITKLGDLDQDGYNDIAIGSPFTEDAGVHIYLGGPNGLSDKPSQILRNPHKTNSGDDMFGHGLSQGSDIDGNFYKDLAVGAPNRDEVYLYKSYPVVKIIGSVKATTNEIRIESKTFIIKACWKLQYNDKYGQRNNQNINITLKVDPTFKRVSFADSESRITKNFVALGTEKEDCTQHTINVQPFVRANSIPIEIEMYYKLVSEIPDNEKFQESAAITNPSDTNFSHDQIIVTTACKNEICLADLIITSSVQPTFTVGSSNTLAVNYTIRNNGEDIAYLPKLVVTISTDIPFGKLSALCMLDHNVLNCDLTDDHKMMPGRMQNWTILLDMTNYSGRGFNISAAVTSAGNENRPADNEILNSIHVEEMSEITFSPHPVQYLVYPTTLKSVNVVNKFDIKNNGPSNIKQMELKLSIPTSYFYPVSSSSIKFIDFDSLKVVAKHNKRNLNMKFTQNNEILKRKVQEEPSENLGFNTFYEEENAASRKKRDAENKVNNGDPLSVQGEIPFNKAIILNCSDIEEQSCILSEFVVYNLQPGNNAIEILVQYELNLEQIDLILDLGYEFFVTSTMLDISRAGDEKRSTLQPNATLANIVISRESSPVPIWIYIISTMAGLLVLVLITYGMHKAGFFRRKKKEELRKLIRESQRGVPRKYEIEANDFTQEM